EKHFPCTFVSIEEFFKDHYPSHGAFRSDEPNAYRAFRELLVKTLREMRHPVVFEQVGLSAEEWQLIVALQAEHRVVLVEVFAELETSLARVRSRGTSTNFTKTPDSVKWVRDLYLKEARPRYSFAAQLVNEDLTQAEICAEFAGILGPGRGSRPQA